MSREKVIRTNRYDYAYATGRISVLKTKLMDQNKMSRLFDSSSIDEIARVLQDSGYIISDSIEESIKNSLIDSYEQVSVMIPNPAYLDALLLVHDFHNLKVILKSFLRYTPQKVDNVSSRGTEESFDKENILDIIQAETKTVSNKNIMPILAYPSRQDPKTLFDAIRDRTLDKLDPFLQNTITEALKGYKNTSDPGEIDLIADRQYFVKLCEYANELDNEFFTEYCAFRSESTNLGTLLRTRSSGTGKYYLSRALVAGGSLSLQTLEDLYESHDEDIKKAYKKTSCEKLSEFASEYGKGNNAAQFGKQIDMTILKLMQNAKRSLFGPEQLIAFLITKEIQTRNINIALTCIRNNVPMNIARDLMREL